MEGDLPKSADKAFQDADQGEARIIFPDVVIGEFVYIALKGRLHTKDKNASVLEMLEELETSSHFEQVNMTQEAWKEFLQSSVRELHDRMIHALARALSADAIITSDEEIRKTGFATIW